MTGSSPLTLSPEARPQTAPVYYVPLPRAMLAELRHRPVVLGVYALVARIFRATKAVVPLSPADICTYDPSISHHVAHRALRSLVESGFLALAESGGTRNAYHPAWGIVGGAPRLWDLAAPNQGLPRHLSVVRLPQELLDRYLGRLEPHAKRGAHVSRYTTRPLLGLADVGAYALTQAGYPAEHESLATHGLVVDGWAAPLPSREATLALVTQRRLFDAESPITLTPAGWASLGMAAPAPEASGTPLIFLPSPSHLDGLAGPPVAPPVGSPIAHPIAPPIAHPIESAPPADQLSGAPQRPRGRQVPSSEGSHGVLRREGEKESTPQTPRPTTGVAGGGITDTTRPGRPAAPATAAAADAQPEAPALARLLQIGVRRDVATTLASRPLAQVERMIALGRGQQGVRDLAAWVVSALRALPAEEPAAPPKVSDMAILTHPGLTNSERLRWLTRFRNADLFDRPAILHRFQAEHPLGSA